MIILDGEKLSRKILDDIKKEIKEKKLKLNLAVVLVGDNSISKSYIDRKKKACEESGIGFELFNFPSDIAESNLKEEINKLSNREDVSGIVIQLPLPKEFNTSEILNLVPVKKDIDVLSESAFKRFSADQSDIFPPVAGAVKHLLNEYGIDIKSKKIFLIGRGRLVGKPLSAWLSNEGAEFSVADRNTDNISSLAREADIIISGAGSPGLVKKDMIKEGAVLIDAGSTSEEGKIKGDIDKDAYEIAGYVAPVPGGVGPMTVACLIDNLVKLNK